MFSERGMNLSELAGVGGSCISWNHPFSICSQRAGWVPCSGCEAGFWGTWPPWPRLCRDVVEQGEPWCWTARRPQGGVLSGPWSWRGLTGTEGQGEPAVWRGLWGGTLSGALCNAGRVCALPVAPGTQWVGPAGGDSGCPPAEPVLPGSPAGHRLFLCFPGAPLTKPQTGQPKQQS